MYVAGRSIGIVWETDMFYQGRYKSFPVQTDEYLYQVLRYAERNALRANLVGRAVGHTPSPEGSSARNPHYQGITIKMHFATTPNPVSLLPIEWLCSGPARSSNSYKMTTLR